MPPEPGRLVVCALLARARMARGCATPGDDRLETRAYAVKRYLFRLGHAARSGRFACSLEQLVAGLAPVMGWGPVPRVALSGRGSCARIDAACSAGWMTCRLPAWSRMSPSATSTGRGGARRSCSWPRRCRPRRSCGWRGRGRAAGARASGPGGAGRGGRRRWARSAAQRGRASRGDQRVPGRRERARRRRTRRAGAPRVEARDRPRARAREESETSDASLRGASCVGALGGDLDAFSESSSARVSGSSRVSCSADASRGMDACCWDGRARARGGRPGRGWRRHRDRKSALRRTGPRRPGGSTSTWSGGGSRPARRGWNGGSRCAETMPHGGCTRCWRGRRVGRVRSGDCARRGSPIGTAWTRSPRAGAAPPARARRGWPGARRARWRCMRRSRRSDRRAGRRRARRRCARSPAAAARRRSRGGIAHAVRARQGAARRGARARHRAAQASRRPRSPPADRSGRPDRVSPVRGSVGDGRAAPPARSRCRAGGRRRSRGVAERRARTPLATGAARPRWTLRSSSGETRSPSSTASAPEPTATAPSWPHGRWELHASWPHPAQPTPEEVPFA